MFKTRISTVALKAQIFKDESNERCVRFYTGGFVAKLCPTLATPWTIAHQAPITMGISRQEYRSGLPFPSPGDLPNPGIKPRSPALQADSFPTELPGKPHKILPREIRDGLSESRTVP